MGPHCTWCGGAFGADAGWPRECASCGRTTWANPIPVGVVVVPVVDGDRTGVLTVRRGIEPHKGELALPGGFLEIGENWRAGSAREVYEETGVRLDNPSQLRLLDVASTPNTRQLLLFSQAAPIPLETVPTDDGGDEVEALVVVYESVPLAFSLHQAVLDRFFE